MWKNILSGYFSYLAEGEIQNLQAMIATESKPF
jgi:hypothetical protein